MVTYLLKPTLHNPNYKERRDEGRNTENLKLKTAIEVSVC